VSQEAAQSRNSIVFLILQIIPFVFSALQNVHLPKLFVWKMMPKVDRGEGGTHTEA